MIFCSARQHCFELFFCHFISFKLQVTVVTNRSNLCSHTETRARSSSLKGEKTEWKWIEESELSATQKETLVLQRKAQE